MASLCRSLSSHLCPSGTTLLRILTLISCLTIENGWMAHAFVHVSRFEKTCCIVGVRLVARSNPRWPALHSTVERNNNWTKGEEALRIMTRRETWGQIALKSSSSVVAGLVVAASLTTRVALAADDETNAQTVLLQGSVTLQSDDLWDNNKSNYDNAALYVTVRPSTVDDIPQAVLDGTRGKSPPILAARFPLLQPQQQFPMAYSVTLQDLTVEGREIWTSANPPTMDGRDWIVSARLDSDGVAATRDPTDLVGRNYYTHSSSSKITGLPLIVDLELQGRGIGGKFFTGK